MAQDETGLRLSRTKFPDRPMGLLGAGKKDDTRSRMSPLRPFETGKISRSNRVRRRPSEMRERGWTR